MTLTKKSHTRVTLALDIVKRIDTGAYSGYHELGTIKHRIDLCDIVTVEDAKKDLIECDNPAVPCDGRNVCLKAANLLRAECKVDKQVRVSLQKQIPVMGGLAGGSANAATTILALNELWGLNLSVQQLVDIGRKTGMDVPYYFKGATCFDSEAGCVLEPVPSILSFSFVLAVPDFGVSTKEAYAGIDYSATSRQRNLTQKLREALITGDRAAALTCMHNDFERTVFSRFPRLGVLRQELLDAGCHAAFLTGSGSTVVGIAPGLHEAEKIGRRLSCKSIIVSTLKL
jgi:4-diphosphocytidyl-2-C-methyl-D-erythritol kinase